MTIYLDKTMKINGGVVARHHSYLLCNLTNKIVLVSWFKHWSTHDRTVSLKYDLIIEQV